MTFWEADEDTAMEAFSIVESMMICRFGLQSGSESGLKAKNQSTRLIRYL
jgi:hypothetical protein